MPVTLIIKTPSLKLSDLTYSCEVTVSVSQLKSYLQTQYPSQPKPEEQRLIYQGRLLRDTEILQDFLRDLDLEQRHTLHLVYTLKRSLSAENNELANMLNGEVPINAVDDGLRLRSTMHSGIPTAVAVGSVLPQQQEWVANGQFPVWANQGGTDPVTQQLLWWQQTYAQHYWAQYMHHFSQSPHEAAPASSTSSIPHSATQTVPQAAVAADADRPQQQQEQQQQQLQRRPPLVAAVGGVAQEEDEDGGIRAARDWLDWIYVGSRLAILLGVMYYYSSLPRFMLVTLIVAGIYLYQKAVNQRRHVAPRNGIEVNNNVGQVAEAPPPAPVADEPAAVANADRTPPPPPPSQPSPPETAAANVTPTAFNVAINLLIGFFTSLIPEVPAPEALN